MQRVSLRFCSLASSEETDHDVVRSPGVRLRCSLNLRLALCPFRRPQLIVDPATLLSGIKSQSALHLSSSARWSTCNSPSYISGLDSLFDEGTPLRRGDIVELQGVTGSGKTQLLLYLSMTAILPRRCGTTQVGGKEAMVAWLDCTLRFDIRKLAGMCRGHLKNMLGEVDEKVLDREVDKCLKRFVLFEPSSMLELAATVQRLPEWYKENGKEEIGYFMIEGMSEFAWADMYATELLTKLSATTNYTPSTAPTPGHSLRLLVAALSRLRSSLAPITFVSQWVFRPSSVTRYSTTAPGDTNQQGLPFYAPHLAPSTGWPSIDRSARYTNTSDDPLAPPSTIPGTNLPSFTFNYHITCHPPSLRVMRQGITMVEAFESRSDGRGEGSEGFRCVLKERGGREVGMWEWEVTSEGGVIA
ncbi:hypothetical protein BCR35DRAFT_286458 [Leucosporidium creatinivorum]|uniref:P-loop containing nucleoside triphosphate hydrolase protein n=1 Tax=Leucosporidium creatinivorum TaxID=106004 RepID=A0A1Y2G2D1_9BASI|nr:hypothetical protein BCR35DRAFT_286458 [Leucosporidium creatinivorum]